MRIFLILAVLLSALSLKAESFGVDERKVDLYFANGILGMAYKSERYSWKVQVKKYKQSNPLIDGNSIGEVDVAFNTSYGAVTDLFESFLQKSDEDPSVKVTWLAFQAFVGRYFSVGAYAVKLDEAVVNEYRTQDLTKQINQYKRSISLGHGVVVIAHSKGNLFTTKITR